MTVILPGSRGPGGRPACRAASTPVIDGAGREAGSVDRGDHASLPLE
jgi:hypothetical protein